MLQLIDPEEIKLAHHFQRYRKEFAKWRVSLEALIASFRHYRREISPDCTAADFTNGASDSASTASRFAVECMKEGLTLDSDWPP